MSQPETPEAGKDRQRHPPPAGAGDEPGTNETQDHPDPTAEPAPDGDPKYVPRSPYPVR